MFTCCLGDGRFGVSTFFASRNLTQTQNDTDDVTNGSNPPVLSPIYHGVQPSVRILGNFQRLFSLSHKNLARYIDAMVGRHEQVVLVQEVYSINLSQVIKMNLYKHNLHACLHIGCQMEMAVEYLHNEGIVVGNLSTSNVMICHPDSWPPVVKLFNYGLFWATEFGALAEFPIMNPSYLAPEVVLSILDVRKDASEQSDLKELEVLKTVERCHPFVTVYSDVWALALILIEVFTATEVGIVVEKYVNIFKFCFYL